MSERRADSIRRRFTADSVRIATDGEQPFVPTSITVKKHLNVVGKDTVLVSVDSELVGTRKAPEPRRATDRLRPRHRLRSDGRADGRRPVRAARIRAGAAIALRVRHGRLTDRVGIYAGVRTGVITLQDAQLYVADGGGTTSLFTLSATSFEFGAPLGLDVTIAGDLHVTVETEYMRRIFNSLSTDPPKGFPTSFPRMLDFSGMSWSVGVQLPLP